MHAFPFTSEINFPPRYTNLAASSPFQWFFFFFLLKAGNKHKRFGAAQGGGFNPPPPPPLPATQLDVGRWDGKQVSPMTFSAQTLQASQSGVLRGRVGGAGLLASHFTIVLLLTDKYWVTPHSHVCHQRLFPSQSMSVQDCVFNINTALPGYTAFRRCSPRSHLTSERWPLRQRREHKVITSKSRRLAYVKSETIGKSAAERDRCGSRRCLCPQRVCQRCSYRPLCFPHKKKINSADYQASIKYLLLTRSLGEADALCRRARWAVKQR